jgi:hypothetical protein
VEFFVFFAGLDSQGVVGESPDEPEEHPIFLQVHWRDSP